LTCFGGSRGGRSWSATPRIEINAGNVVRLKLVFSFRTGQKGGQSDAPAVAGDLLLLQTAFPHTLYALDIHHQATPVRWPFARLPNRHAAGLSCCDAKAKPPGRHIRLAGEHATGRALLSRAGSPPTG
jgi:glucose dehydrogenase